MLPFLLDVFHAPHWVKLRDYAPAFVAFKRELQVITGIRSRR